MRKSILYIILASAIFTSCETQIKYEGEITEQQMAVFSNIMPDSIVSCYVLQSYFFQNVPGKIKNSPYLHEEEILKDAVVKCKINSGEWILLNQMNSNWAFTTNNTSAIVHTGDTVTLDVNHPTYGNATAQQVIPNNAEIKLIDYNIQSDTIRRITNPNDPQSVRYVINYDIIVRLNARSTKENTVGRFTAAVMQNDRKYNIAFSSTDVIFTELNDQITSGMGEIFGNIENENIVNNRYSLYYPMPMLSADGETLTLVFSINANSAMARDSLSNTKLHILSDVLTQDNYLYRVSVENNESSASGLSDLGVEEKVQIYSNFSHEIIGCFVAQSAVKTIEIDFSK